MGKNNENETEVNSILTEELRILLKQKLPIVANVCLVLFIGGFVLQSLAPVLQPFAMAVLVYLILRPGAKYLMREFKIIQDINISIPPPLPGSKNFSIKNETWDLIQKKFKELKRIENKMWRLSKKLYDMAYHDLGNQVKGTVDELDILNSNLLVGVNILKNKIRDGIEFNNVENVLKFMGDMEEIIKGEIIKLKDFENFLNHMVKVRDNSFQKAA